jgi:hypothetical protein
MSHVGTLTMDEPEPGRRLYTLLNADGAPLGTYEAEHRDGGWQVYAPGGAFIGVEPDGPEVAMRITLHAMPGPQ